MRHHKQSCLRKEDLPDLAEDSEEAQMVLGTDHGVEDNQDLGQRISLQEERDQGRLTLATCLIPSDCCSDLISRACHPFPGPPSTSGWCRMSGKGYRQLQLVLEIWKPCQPQKFDVLLCFRV